MAEEKLSAQPPADAGTEADFGLVTQSGQTRKQTRPQLRTAILSAWQTFIRTFLASATAADARAAIGAISLSDTGSFSGSAAKLTTARTISATGDAAWTASFDGSANVTSTITLSSAGTAGTYGSVTTDAKGRVTAGSVATPIANGGTGATGQTAALTALLGASLVPIANGGTGSAATAMVSLTLQNSWTVAAGGRAAYRKLVDFVYLELRVTGGTATDGTVIATLPAGFRPFSQVVVPVASPPNTALSTTIAGPRIVINTDGTITCANCTNVTIQGFCTFSLT